MGLRRREGGGKDLGRREGESESVQLCSRDKQTKSADKQKKPLGLCDLGHSSHVGKGCQCHLKGGKPEGQK